MIKNLDDSMGFGKYNNYSILELYKGCIPTSTFIEYFFKVKLGEIESMEFFENYPNNGKGDKIKVVNFLLHPNNQIEINLNSFTNNKKSATFLNYGLMSSDEFPDKGLFGSANDLIIEYNQNLRKQLNKRYDELDDSIYLANRESKKVIEYEKQIKSISSNLDLIDSFISTGIWPINITSVNELLPQELFILSNEIGIKIGEDNFDLYIDIIHEYLRKEILKSYDFNYISPVKRILQYYKSEWKSEVLKKPILLKEKMVEFCDRYPKYMEMQNEYKLNKLRLFANPGYIFWAIEKVEDFVIDPKIISELEFSGSNLFYGIELTHFKKNLYKYKIKYSNRNIPFSPQIKEKNLTKYNLYISEEEYLNDDYEDFRESSHYGGSCCDLCGGSGECLLSDPQGCPRSSF